MQPKLAIMYRRVGDKLVSNVYGEYKEGDWYQRIIAELEDGVLVMTMNTTVGMPTFVSNDVIGEPEKKPVQKLGKK